MQLNVDVSPPANIMTLRLCLTHVTFDLDHMTLTHMTFDLEQYLVDGQMRPESTFLTC